MLSSGSETMKCKICGSELEAGESRCRYCGNEISAAETDTVKKTDKGGQRLSGTKVSAAAYARSSTDNSAVDTSSEYDDVVLDRNRITRAVYCSKCGRPLDGRTGKCIVCDYAAVGQAAYMMNNTIEESGETYMAGRKRKKRHTALAVVLSVLGIMALFAIAVVAAFYMMGGFNHDEEEESPSPVVVTEAAERATATPQPDTPSATPEATAVPVITSNPSMEPEKGDPASFKGGSYIYPSHKQVITDTVLMSYAATEESARLLYYELFARYGMEFDDDDLIEYFERQVWYTPDGGSNESKIIAQFNDIEKENEKTIRKYMKENDWY